MSAACLGGLQPRELTIYGHQQAFAKILMRREKDHHRHRHTVFIWGAVAVQGVEWTLLLSLHEHSHGEDYLPRAHQIQSKQTNKPGRGRGRKGKQHRLECEHITGDTTACRVVMESVLEINATPSHPERNKPTSDHARLNQIPITKHPSHNPVEETLPLPATPVGGPSGPCIGVGGRGGSSRRRRSPGRLSVGGTGKRGSPPN